MSGDLWKAKDSVLFFIYTPVIAVSLASKQASTTNKPKLLAIVILSPSITLSR